MGREAVTKLPGSTSADAAGPGLSKEFFCKQRPSGLSKPEPWGWSWDGPLGRRPAWAPRESRTGPQVRSRQV
jgi:hypothetical protein